IRQGGDALGFALETREPIRVARHARRQHLQGDEAVQAGVARLVDLAHAAGAQRRDDFIRTESIAGRHRALLYSRTDGFRHDAVTPPRRKWSAKGVAMTLTQQFIAELDREAPRTRRVLLEVPHDR